MPPVSIWRPVPQKLAVARQPIAQLLRSSGWLSVAPFIADRPSTKRHKPVSALPPQMSAVLIWARSSSVACALLSHGLVVGEDTQDSLVRPLVHTSRLDRHGIVSAPFEPGAQFLYPTSRAIPPMAHVGLIGNPSAFATSEKPDPVMVIPSIENTRRAATFAARKHEVAPAIVCFPPVAADFLPQRIQPLAAGRPYGEFQHKPLCVWATSHLKINGPE